MINNKRFLITLDLFLTIIFPAFLISFSFTFSQSVRVGMFSILLLALLSGIIIPNYLISWLVIILTTFGIAFLLIGYVIMPNSAKHCLILAFPVEASLVSVITNYVIHWKHEVTNFKDAKRLINHYDLHLKLQTEYNAIKFLNHEMNLIRKNPDYHLSSKITLISWANHQQFEQFNHDQHADNLLQIAKILKNTRLASEFIYYLGNATFAIISPNINEEVAKKVDNTTFTKLQILPAPLPQHLKFASERISNDNIKNYRNAKAIFKHLKRELETDLITEYLIKDGTHE